MGEGITLAATSNAAARSPTREGCGASRTTLSNNEASKVVHSNESHKDFILGQGYFLIMGETYFIIVLSNMVS